MNHLISQGNAKLGKIPNVSSIPVKDCINCSSCAKDCYALKAFRQYKTVRTLWSRNSAILHRDAKEWGERVIVDLKKKRNLPYFRFQVAGDLISEEHFKACVVICNTFPHTKFLMFTKAYKFIDLSIIPSNLIVKLSTFEGMNEGSKPSQALVSNLGIASASKEESVENAFTCGGSCKDCKYCFTNNGNVHFKIH